VDETTITQALTVLQNQFGRHLDGDMLKGEVAMRQALMQQLQMDESTADKVVKQLAQTGWLRFRSGTAPTAADGLANPGATAAPAVQPQASAPGVTDAWNDTRVTTGNPATDASVRAEPIIAGGAVTGFQSGNIGAGAAGGAYVGAAAAGLAGARVEQDAGRGERPDPDRDENQVSSFDADRSTADESGHWMIAAPGDAPLPPRS
jgi:hypothetical protein